MSIGTEILSLRRDQNSSLSFLLGAIEWQSAAQNADIKLMRGHAVMQAADLVLLNTAVHALEMQDEPHIRETRRAALPPHRKRRRADPGMLLQRQHRLFA
jgi:hypothetical protein